MKILFFSDLHLRGPEDPIYSSVIQTLQSQVQAGDILVLAGDIFDAFVSRRRVFMVRYERFFQTLKSLRGVEIHYVEGNHDFLLNRALEDVEGARAHPCEVILSCGGKKFYIAHGDLVNVRDKRYRLIRSAFRSLPMRMFFHYGPDRWVDRFGSTASEMSRVRSSSDMSEDKIKRMRGTFRDFARSRLEEGFDYVVLGHCHDLDESDFVLMDQRAGQYINMGYPPEHHFYLEWSPGEAKIQRRPLAGF